MKLEMNKFDGAIIISGFVMALSAWIRFFTLPSDLGETFLAGMLGLVIMFVGWIHNNQYRNWDRDQKRYEEYLALAEYIQDKPWELENE